MEQAENKGKWKRGQTGNAKGRPRGAGEPAKLRAAIAEHVPDIIAKLVEQAKAGDAQSARLLLERVLAPVKASEAPVSIDLPVGSAAEQGSAILRAVAAGQVAPGQGAQILASLASVAQMVKLDELVKRLEAIESQRTSR